MPELEFFEDESTTSQRYRFRIRGGNGEIVFTSEGYDNKYNARRGFFDLVRIVNEVKEQL